MPSAIDWKDIEATGRQDLHLVAAIAAKLVLHKVPVEHQATVRDFLDGILRVDATGPNLNQRWFAAGSEAVMKASGQPYEHSQRAALSAAYTAGQAAGHRSFGRVPVMECHQTIEACLVAEPSYERQLRALIGLPA
ncbi:MAG: hypothetical protein SF069_07375 [Phycisphaerae bacterium]|nr:hypothetical protein [Phycisphaerae bacterium]